MGNCLCAKKKERKGDGNGRDELGSEAEGLKEGANKLPKEFKVNENIKKGLHVLGEHPDNQHYATLAGIQGDVLPQDGNPAPGGGAPFKVDEKIKQGLHVNAEHPQNQNYATLANIGDDALPKDAEGVAGPGDGKGNFKVNENIKKGLHVLPDHPQNQNYATLGCLQGDDVLLPKDTDGPGKAGPGGGKGDFKVDEKIKKGLHVMADHPQNQQNYATLGCLQGDDVLLPKDAEGPGPGKAGPGGAAPGGVAANAGGKPPDFKVDERIKKGRHVDPAAQNNQNYATLAGLQDIAKDA